jgi:hypothetical protein
MRKVTLVAALALTAMAVVPAYAQHYDSSGAPTGPYVEWRLPPELFGLLSRFGVVGVRGRDGTEALQSGQWRLLRRPATSRMGGGSQ